MGNKTKHHHPLTSPGSPGGKMKTRDYFFLGAAVVFFISTLIFLGLYLELKLSDPAKQLGECQSQLQNQSSQTQAQITSLRQRVEETQEAAEKEAGNLNGTLAETQKNWQACQNQLSVLQDNFTTWEAEEHSHKENIKNLQQQLTEKSKQLDDEQRKIQDERKRHQEEIQELREELQQKQRTHHSTSGGGDFAGPSITLLAIVIAGFLCV